MKRLLPLILILTILLSGCGALNPAAPAADATATISVEDIRATADAMVYAMLTQTQAAMPTNTPVPPTDTPTPVPTATITLVPTIAEDAGTTDDVAATPTTAAAAIIPTSTTSTSSATFPCTEKPLTSWDVNSATVTVTNNAPNSTQAYVFFCITTIDGQAGYITVNAGSSAQIPYGYVTATAWVSGKKDFNATIGFEVKSPDSTQIVIEDGRIYYRASCAPGC